jgi:alkanesulfonate monooxygenase
MAAASRPGRLHLNAFLMGVGHHEAAWRLPESDPHAHVDVEHYKNLARIAERGKLDSLFLADGPVLWDDIGRRPAGVLEPTVLLTALAGATEHIGLIATASTTYNEPYNLARRFASLDHISGGRAGWNIVTTSNPDAALNFGMDALMEHDERYERAREFYDVVTGLWDSWADDAFIRDVDSGVFFEPSKMHTLNHKGEFLSVKGPLNIARPIQGWPLIVQAGASESGKQLAAETAEAVFTSQSNIEAGKAFYADVKGRMQKLGRNPDHLKIQPACFVVVGDTVEEAKAKRAKLDSLVDYANAIASLSIALGTDASKFDPDGPLPEIPDSNASKSGRERAIAAARRDKLTVRQLAQRMGGYSGLAMVGTPKTIADEMEEWMETRASDGFTIMFPYLPGGLDDFVRGVIPELQRRGLFRREYEGKTLRENLGLPRPENRFFDRSRSVAAE